MCRLEIFAFFEACPVGRNGWSEARGGLRRGAWPGFVCHIRRDITTEDTKKQGKTGVGEFPNLGIREPWKVRGSRAGQTKGKESKASHPFEDRMSWAPANSGDDSDRMVRHSPQRLFRGKSRKLHSAIFQLWICPIDLAGLERLQVQSIWMTAGTGCRPHPGTSPRFPSPLSSAGPGTRRPLRTVPYRTLGHRWSKIRPAETAR